MVSWQRSFTPAEELYSCRGASLPVEELHSQSRSFTPDEELHSWWEASLLPRSFTPDEELHSCWEASLLTRSFTLGPRSFTPAEELHSWRGASLWGRGASLPGSLCQNSPVGEHGHWEELGSAPVNLVVLPPHGCDTERPENSGDSLYARTSHTPPTSTMWKSFCTGPLRPHGHGILSDVWYTLHHVCCVVRLPYIFSKISIKRRNNNNKRQVCHTQIVTLF